MAGKRRGHVHNAPSNDETMFPSQDPKPKRIYQLWPGNNVCPFFLQATDDALYWKLSLVD